MDEFDAGGGSAVSQVREVYGGSYDQVYAAGGGGTGHWEFNPEEIDAIIKQWEGLLQDIEDDRKSIRAALHLVTWPVSEDVPTSQYQKLLLDGVRSLDDSNLSMMTYVKEYVDRLREAKAQFEKTDADAAGALGGAEA